MSDFQPYQTAYAKRHHIPPDWIIKEERLELAAFLEHMVVTHTLSLTDARRRYVNEYPDANRLDVPKYIYEWKNGQYTYRIDHKYSFGSVLQLIQPNEDSIIL